MFKRCINTSRLALTPSVSERVVYFGNSYVCIDYLLIFTEFHGVRAKKPLRLFCGIFAVIIYFITYF